MEKPMNDMCSARSGRLGMVLTDIIKSYWSLALFLVWMAVGVFPLSCYENDSMHLLAGCSVMANQGVTVPPPYSYFYDMQPLVSYVVVGLNAVFAWLTCEQLYCLVTWFAACFAVVGTVRFCRRLTLLPVHVLVFALLFLPESYACAMYPNSAVPAYACFVWAMCMVLDGRFVLAVALMGLAPLFRIDVVIVYPVLLPLLLFVYGRKKVWRCVALSAVAAVAVVAIVTVGCAAMGADPVSHTLGMYSSFDAGGQYSGQVKYALFTFYTIVSVVVLPLGVVVLWRRRSLLLLVTCLLPMLLLHYMFRRTGCAGKHWLYILPFVLMLCSTGWAAIARWCNGRRGARYAVAALVVLYAFCSVRITIPPAVAKVSKAWVGNERQEGPFLTLFSEDLTPMKCRFGIGAGQFIPTADEMMIASGNVFYPFYIHAYKSNKDAMRREAKAYADTLPCYDIAALAWGDRIWYQNLLLDDGYAMTGKNDDGYVLRKGGSTVDCYYVHDDIPKGDAAAAYRTLKPLKRPGRPLLVVPETDARAYVMDKLVALGKAVRHARRCYEVR